MQLGFYFDQTRCTGCHTCNVACKDWHDIDAGPVNWMRVTTIGREGFPMFSWHGSLYPAVTVSSPTV